MAKIAGKATKFSIDRKSDLALTEMSLDTYSVDFSYELPDLDVTGFTSVGHERIIGLSDATINVRATYNDTVDRSYDLLSGAWNPSETRTVRYFPKGGASPYWTIETFMTSFTISASADGRIELGATFVVADGTAPVLTA